MPDSVEASVPLVKQVPALKKPKPVMSSGPLSVSVKAVTKFSWLAGPWPPVNCTSQLPLVVVFCSVEGLVVPQPQTASSSTSNIRIARIFNLPSLNWGSL